MFTETGICPSHVNVPDEALHDQRSRQQAARWPADEIVSGGPQRVQPLSPGSQAMRRLATTELPTKWGVGRLDVFGDGSTADGQVVALSHYGAGASSIAIPLVRLHSVCLTGDVLGSLCCDCGPQLQASLIQIMSADHGILLYALDHEGRGIGLVNKIHAMRLQSEGADTVSANLALSLPVDDRDYGYCAAALTQLGVNRVRLLTNNPEKLAALGERGIEVVERVPLVGFENRFNARYLATKELQLGHLFETAAGRPPRFRDAKTH